MADPAALADRWKGDIPVPAHVIQYVDQAVRDKLPSGTEILGISPSGASFWARTAKIDARNDRGESTPFFIKVNQSEHGKNMVSSEFRSMKLLHETIPEMVAEPIAWGAYVEEPDIYFFVCRFVEMSDDIPDVSDFPKMIAEMHKRGTLMSGQFGMPYVTYSGRNAQYFPPSNSWEECFSRGLRAEFDQEEQTHGPDEEMQRMRDELFSKVIPRLLRPLETEGRTLLPQLVHGDLWDGNASIDVNTGNPMIFDAVPIYAHNEYELAPWWAPRHKMTDEYIAEYFAHFPAAEPAEDFRDRGLLYMLRFDIHSSSLYPGTLRGRGVVLDAMRDLLQRHSGGYEAYANKKGLSLGMAGSAVQAAQQFSPAPFPPLISEI